MLLKERKGFHTKFIEEGIVENNHSLFVKRASII